MEKPQSSPEAENKSEGGVKILTFHGKGKAGQGEQFETGQLSNFGRLWAIGVPGTGMDKPARLLNVSLEASLGHPYFKHD